MNKEKFTSRMGRTVEKNMLVGVHWNAHKNCWSIVQFKSRHAVGLVLGYAENITLRDCTTHIDKSKQKKVRVTEKKDRHAFIVGYVESFEPEGLDNQLYYNPHQLDNFVDRKNYSETQEKKYLENMSRVSLDHWKNLYPVVRYSA